MFFRRAYLTLILFLARGIIAGVFQAAYVYTPEVYPTSLRAVGVGSCSAMARLGAMVTPYVAQVSSRFVTEFLMYFLWSCLGFTENFNFHINLRIFSDSPVGCVSLHFAAD